MPVNYKWSLKIRRSSQLYKLNGKFIPLLRVARKYLRVSQAVAFGGVRSAYPHHQAEPCNTHGQTLTIVNGVARTTLNTSYLSRNSYEVFIITVNDIVELLLQHIAVLD